MPKIFLNLQNKPDTPENALVSFCNDNQRQSAQLGIHGDSSESLPEEQLKSTTTTGSTDDENDSRKRRKCTDNRQTDVGRQETKIQTTNGVTILTKSFIQPQSLIF